MAMPLDDLIAADPEGQAFVDDFIDGFMLDSYVDGQTYSIPFQRSTMVMFYNKDAFNEVGLDPEAPPANWTEMVEYAQKLTNDKRYGVGIALNSGSAQWAFTGFSLENCTNGVGLMNPNGKEVYSTPPKISKPCSCGWICRTSTTAWPRHRAVDRPAHPVPGWRSGDDLPHHRQPDQHQEQCHL